MKFIKVITSSLAAFLMLVAACGAHAAQESTLTCKGQSGNVIFTAQLAGFNVDNPGLSSEKANAAASGKNTGPTFSVQFSLNSQAYGILFQTLAQNQVIPSCALAELTPVEGRSPAVAAQWSYQNVSVADLSASSGQSSNVAWVQATFTAQRVSFTSNTSNTSK